MKNKELVIDLAKKTRYWSEKYAKKNGFKSCLAGMCGIASCVLHQKMLKHGITDVKICCNSFHCFLTYDNYIIDITATQFQEKEKVFIKPIKDFFDTQYYLSFNWDIHQTFDNYQEFRLYQESTGWPRKQLAFSLDEYQEEFF